MQPGGNPAIFFVFMLLIAYFMLIRPEQKRRKEHKAMMDNLKKNDQVVTSSGIHATVVNVKESTFVLRIDENTKIEIDKISIAYVKKVK
jgi:preprotein translocase subunit YajC